MTGRFATLFVKQGVYCVQCVIVEFTLSDKLFAHFKKAFFYHGEHGAEVFPATFPIQLRSFK